MAMSKKDFIALADFMRENWPYSGTEQQQNETMAEFLQMQNPRFKRDRWLGYIAGTNGKNGGSK